MFDLKQNHETYEVVTGNAYSYLDALTLAENLNSQIWKLARDKTQQQRRQLRQLRKSEKRSSLKQKP